MKRPLATVICLAIVMVPIAASAKPGTKIALAKVEGDKGGEVGKAVTDALDGSDLTIVPPKEVTRVVEKLGYSDDLSEKEMKKVQAELDAAAYVQGKVEKDAAGRKLHFNVFVNGKKAKGFSLEFANAKSDKFKKAVKETMLAKIGAITGDAPAEPVADKADKADKKKGKKVAEADDTADDPKAKKKGKKVAEADDTADDPKAKKKGKKTAEADADADDSKAKKKGKKTADADADADDPKAKKKGKADKGKKVADADADADDDPKAKKKGKKTADADADDDPKAKKKGKADKGKKVADADADDDPKAKKKKGGTDADLKVEASVDIKADTKSDEESDGAKGPKEVVTAKPKQVSASDAEASAGDSNVIVAHPLASSAPMHAANRVAIRLDAGMSFANRSLKFASRDFAEGMGPPPAYSNKFVPGMRIDGELYPLAFGSPSGVLGGLGFAGEYDKTFSLKLRTAQQPDTQLASTVNHYEIGIRYRIGFGSSPTSPTVTLAAGYGQRKFTTDRTPLNVGNVLDLPDTTYKYIDPGLDLRIPLMKSIAFFAGGRAMLVTSAGQITQPTGYGQAKILGYMATGGLDIILGSRIAVRLEGEFAQVGLKFTATGDSQATNRDGDPTSPDVSSATDRSIGGAATLAILY